MFDELKNNQVTPSGSLRPMSAPLPPAPARAEDIFSEVDKTVKPEVFTPSQDNFNPPRGTVIPEEMTRKNKKLAIIGLSIGGLVIIAAGGYVGLKLAATAKPAANNAIVQEQPISVPEIEAPVTAPAEEINEIGIPPIQPIENTPIDTDQDGLTDTEEAALGTDSNNPDTDQDGLTDREEINVYLTDPLKPDTDGDGFKDGDEVKNGYNPKGSGKLLEIVQ